MAEEFASMAQFGEFVKRIEGRFDHLGKELVNMNMLADERYDSINRRLADAEKARDQNQVHVNQRLDDMKESVDHRFNSLEKMLAWHNIIVMGIQPCSRCGVDRGFS